MSRRAFSLLLDQGAEGAAARCQTIIAPASLDGVPLTNISTTACVITPSQRCAIPNQHLKSAVRKPLHNLHCKGFSLVDYDPSRGVAPYTWFSP
ncbi:hypothetical protein M406DRAFT_58746 [Cryphonectria parasitica EP155]|uniref:Uncharacterized protein n=1 Tax=Cryphonectria parasitica (strain ATCC 38755 / EP155) TaxID=660469 RepID=A0A9P4XW30_CRYP1|nr:uncharacterized protein M406DRAFT_58746 [Cryphonectria parasitica EP155]KAF3762073.1 hypothetical protein M406DRAFT_58746 [Cryphonectria parasitica EP155]